MNAAELDPRARLCVVLLTGVGDVVNGLPLVNAIRDRYPGWHVTWVAEPAPAAVLAHHPSVDEVIVYHMRRGIAGVRALRREIARRRFDLTINLNIYFKSVWPTVFSRAPLRFGFGPDRARDLVWMFANRRLPPRPRRHTLDMFLEFADPLGVPVERVEWRLGISAAERGEQRDFFGSLADRPTVALVPASANAKKDWLPERWAAVADALHHDFGMRAMLVGGPGARETTIARDIVQRARAAPLWAMGDGVRRVVWQLDGCALAIAPDTGPLHIARALEVPVIGLFGHTNPWRVGPYRAYEDLWVDRYSEPDAEPDPGAHDPRHERMETITVADVLERVERARDRYGVDAR